MSLLSECCSLQGHLARKLDEAAVFITGASGCLAANLICFLSVLRSQTGIRLRIAASARRPATTVPLFTFLNVAPPDEWQIASAEDTAIPRNGNWIVVHAASYASPADYMRHPIATYEANTRGVTHLLGQLDRRTCEHFVYFSSAEVYGQPPDSCIPTSEEYAGGPSLSDPRSIYGESKRMAELLASTVAAQKDIPVSVIRPWNVYGPGQRLDDGRVPMDFFRQLLTSRQIQLLSDGTPTRSFCHAWEAMPQIGAVLRRPEDSNNAFNIGRTGDQISISTLARMCANVVGLNDEAVAINSNARAQGLRRCEPMTSKVLQLLGTPPRGIPLEEGLVTVASWAQYLSCN